MRATAERSPPAEVAYGVGLWYRDLQFKRVPVQRATTSGVPYFSMVDVGMPTIPKAVLESVVYLYPDRASALAGKSFGGSGFIVGVRSATHPTASYLYVVSNYHVAIRDGCSVVRVNTRDGGVNAIDLDVSDWEYSPDGGDVAIAPLPVDLSIQALNFWDVSHFLRLGESDSGFIGPGDDVFMAGRFIDHDGGQTNAPAVRFGNVSVDPSHLPGTVNSNNGVRYYCLDMHSRTGFSGSPVFAFRTPGADLNNAFNHGLNLQPPVLKLLGIHCGQFQEDLQLKGDESSGPAKVIRGFSGMTYALPAWHIRDLLNSPKLVEWRAAQDAQWKDVNFPCEE